MLIYKVLWIFNLMKVQHSTRRPVWEWQVLIEIFTSGVRTFNALHSHDSTHLMIVRPRNVLDSDFAWKITSKSSMKFYVCIPQASLEFDFSNGLFFFCLGATNHQTSNAFFGHWNSVFKFEWFCWRCLKNHSLTAPHKYVKLFFEFLTNEFFFVWPFRSFWPCRLALKISFDTEL